MSGEYHRVRIAESAKKDLRHIGKKYGKKTYETIRELIVDLEFDPEKKGEALRAPLHGLHSLHYSRFRIIYRIDRGEFIVVVIGAGHHESDSRSDIYRSRERLIESGKLVIRSEEENAEPLDED